MVFGLIFLIFFSVVILLSIALLAVRFVSLWKIFVKAGRPGWFAIIPFYNSFVLADIGGTNIIWPIIFVASPIMSFLLTFCISFGVELFELDVNYDVLYPSTTLLSMLFSLLIYVATFVMMINLAKKFNKDTVFGVGLALVPIVFLPWLAFDKSEYNSSVKTVRESSKVLCTNCGELNSKGTNFCTNCGEKL